MSWAKQSPPGNWETERLVSLTVGAEATSLCVLSHSRDGGAVTLAPKQAGERKGGNLRGRRESRQEEGPWKEAEVMTLSQMQEERGPADP